MPDRMTDDQLVALALARGGTVRRNGVSLTELATLADPKPARRRIPVTNAKGQNKTEARFDREFLAPKKHKGEIQDYKFESVNFRLADRELGKPTHYRPDFVVWNLDLTQVVYEIKGFMREDARLKYIMFVEKYPYIPLYVVRWEKRSFRITRWGRGD